MQNFSEKFAELVEYVNHCGNEDLADCVRYLRDVLIPHCQRMENQLRQFEDVLYLMEDELTNDLHAFTEGRRPEQAQTTVIV